MLDDSTFTGLRMRFPADREFEFEVSYGRSSSDGYETVIEVKSRGDSETD